jgi:hypothetical protein
VSQADRDALSARNSSYVASVRKGDVSWFREHLADDFMCTNPDACFLDKAGFLELIGKPARITGLSVGVRKSPDWAVYG